MEKILFTSESVTEGHPDKICDAISDAVLDALIEQDPMSRVACETAITTGLVLVMGEITSTGYVDIQKIVRDTVREIGYTRGKYGFDADTCGVITAIDEQSADIALGVDKALEAKMGEDEIDAIGAGDQGIQFGFASNETEEYMPYAINMAHKLARQLTKVRKDGTLKYLRPDGKTQVTVEYSEEGKPVRIDAVVCSTQHDPDVTQEQIHADIRKYVLDAVIPADMVDDNTKYFINPTGRFVSEDLTETVVLQAVRSSWTATADTDVTAAELFPEKTAPRWIVPQLTRPVMWQRILLRRDLRINVRSSFPTLSELPVPLPLMWKHSEQENFPIRNLWRSSEKTLISVLRESSACLI